ncbi:GNAT family N-acetyltransferase [Haloferax sp. S1W]|uniref:GNAT family N-acetyltransferase n=1 Tax=Haloferax sp. S1W TaxID=3377110 RepID=UPI0037C64809
MRVTSATVDDLDALADLWVELAAGQRAFGSHLRAELNRTPIRETLARHVALGGVLIAHERGERDSASADEEDDSGGSSRVVGFVMFNVESGAYEQDVTRGTISNLFVVPDRRGDGVGSELLAAAEDELEEWGADVVALDVMAENENARKFYRRHGYQPHRIQLEKSMRNDTHSKEDQ